MTKLNNGDPGMSFLQYLITDDSIDSFLWGIKYYRVVRSEIDEIDEEIRNPYSSEAYSFDNDLDDYVDDMKREKIELQRNLESIAGDLEDFWQSYLKWTDAVNSDREEEVKKVLKWCHQHDIKVATKE